MPFATGLALGAFASAAQFTHRLIAIALLGLIAFTVWCATNGGTSAVEAGLHQLLALVTANQQPAFGFLLGLLVGRPIALILNSPVEH